MIDENRHLKAFSVLLVFLTFSTLSITPVFAQSSGCSIDVLRSDNSGFEFAVEVLNVNIQPEIQNGVQRCSISIPDEPGVGAPGIPNLPRISRLIAVPATAKIKFTWDCNKPQIISSAPPVVHSEGDPLINQTMIRQVPFSYENDLYPPQIVELGKPSIMRGVRLVRVTVNPVQYDVSTGNLIIRERINVSLSFSNGEAINPVNNPGVIKPSKTVNRLLRSLVINPESIDRDDGGNGTIVYVIPDYNGVAEAIAPLVEWRKRQGYPTEILVVDDDANTAAVKRAIDTAYEEWGAEIVCLVGDADRENAAFRIPTYDVGRAYVWETDYTYSLIEGEDLLPEIAIGRISARSVNELQLIVNDKIYPYEAEPYLDNSDWYQKAALMANDERTGYSSVYVQRWARKMLMEVGIADVDTFYFIHDNNISGHDFIEESIDNGILLFNYRGWGQFSGDWDVGDVSDLNNRRMLPFIVMPTCNTGDFADHVQFQHAYSEDFLWARNGGAIGSVGSSGFTHTNYNNVLDGGILNGFFRDDAWHFGWALVQGKIELYRHFGMFNDVDDPQVNSLKVWEAHCYQSNLIGDPATQLWTDVPKEIDVGHPDLIAIGENRITVTVDDTEREAPLVGAMVTLLANGELIRAEETDSRGRVNLVFEIGELEAGTLDLTVTKHNAIPYLGEIEVEGSSRFLGVSTFAIDDDGEGESAGNGDETANPGERVELRTFVKNFGENRPEGEIILTLDRVYGEIEIVDGDASIDNAPELGDSLEVIFVVDIANDNCNCQEILLNLTAVNGDDEWESPVTLEVAAPNLEIIDFTFEPSPFDIGDTVTVEITLHNEGQIRSPRMRDVELISLQDAVAVFNPYTELEPVDVEEGDTLITAQFLIHAYSAAIPGTEVQMLLKMESEAGFKDSSYFSYVVDQADDGTPFGPDAYGYGCFDNTDESWDIAPVYEWIEIDPDLDGEDGVDTEMNDLGNERDKSTLMDLPFTFTYYGEDFDEITICTNGWFTMGDESKISDFQNRRIPPALGPRAQLCVFWDDLVNYREGQNRIGGVYTWFDEENHRFIIEWSRMRRYIGMTQNNQMREGAVNTFQAILYDPQVYQTYTGDGDIVFQYHTANNRITVDPDEFDTPYATVGIVNLNGTDGMEYTYWNEYPVGAAELEDGRAIKFTTALIIATGTVRGTVLDDETDLPISNAEIRGNPTSFGVANRAGEFNFNVLVGDDYSFTAWAPGYNEQTIENIDIIQGRTRELQFSLLHPEFTASSESVAAELAPDNSSDASITIFNSGNGELNFRSYYDYVGEEGGEMWSRLMNFNVTDSTDDDRIHGVGFVDSQIWVVGSNVNQNPNKFYRFNRNGEYDGTTDQPTGSSYGFRGIAIVGDLIYGGERDLILGVNVEGEVVDSIPGPLQIQRALAYDPLTETFWVANSTDSIKQINRAGEVLMSVGHELDIHGLGFLADDPDGYPLYIVSRNKTDLDLRVPEALVTKFNPETGDLRTEAVLEGEIEDRVAGMEIVSTFDSRKWVMLAIMTNPDGDQVSIYDVGPNTNWIQFAPMAGTIEPDNSMEIELHFNSAGLEEGDYELALRFDHNASGQEFSLPVLLNVDEDHDIAVNAQIPYEFGLNQNFPNPFNPSTTISFSIPTATHTSLRVFDITGREVADLVNGKLKAGVHSALFNGKNLPTGIYLMKLEAAGRKAIIKTALIK